MIDPRQNVAGAGKRQAVASGLVAAALTLSLAPGLAYADNEKVGTASTATNTEAAPTDSEDAMSSSQDYSVIAQSDDAAASNDYDLSTIDLTKIADGTYTATVKIDADSPLNTTHDWDSYEIAVATIIAGGKIADVDVSQDDLDKVYGLDEDSGQRMENALNGTKRKTGMADLIVKNQNTGFADVFTTATLSSNAVKEGVYKALVAAYNEQNPVAPTDEYTYGYVGLTWAEYWANENVYAAGDAASSDALDSRDEYDKGAFDAVSRATTNHGLHRGSYQCEAIMETTGGKTINVSYWADDGKSFVTTEGETVQWSKPTVTFADGTTDTQKDYKVVGLKYVPVKVKTVDLDALKASHAFVANGEEMHGGYSEKSLSAWHAVADVDAETYGLKTATNNGGTFSFSAREAAGSDSGLKDQALKTASGVTVTQKAGTEVGQYGEFIRVDLAGDYGDLGANMQSVTWTYYADDAARTNVKRAFGTKFAADNWMHKSMGIQLGLTESLRAQLPEGTDGTGYWTVTVHALGYQDYSFDIEATADNIAKDETPVTEETKQRLQDLYDQANSLNEDDYTADSWANLVTERDETRDLLAKDGLLESEASGQIEHLQGAIDGLKKLESQYVLLNIPYDKFYEADLNNSVKVDSFTSATKNKSRTGGMVGGSYHVNADGSDITGVTFPVKVPAGTDIAALAEKLGGQAITDSSSVDVTVTNRGQSNTTTYSGKDALFEAPSYSYYVTSETPSFCKDLVVADDGSVSFSEVKGSDGQKATAQTISGVSSTLKTDTSYGDYELDFDTDATAATKLADSIPGGARLYQAIVNTKEGASYGLRHMENVWFPKGQMELSWGTGFTTMVRNCPVSSEHYKAMMGQTITSVTFVTEKGIFEVPVENGYVPVKFSTDGASADDAQKGAVSTKVTLPALPADFDAQYSIEGWNGDAQVADGSLAIPAGQANGAYALEVTDKSGKYVGLSIGFQIKADAAVSYDAAKTAIVTTDGSDVTGYTGEIASVTVDGTKYNASGRGAKKVINDDGTLNLSEDPLKSLAYGDHAIVIKASGFNDYSFTYIKQADKTALNEAISAADQLKESDYTKASWEKLAEALSAAKSTAGKSAATEDEIQKAAEGLTQAQDALELLATADDKAALQAAIDKQFTEVDCTAASWSDYQKALASAKDALTKDELTQKEAQDAIQALTDAQSALAKKASGEAKDDLQTEINKSEAFDKGDYTADSWGAYQKALDAAKALLESDDASELDVQQALEDLRAARAALVNADGTPVDPQQGEGADDPDAADEDTASDESPKTGDFTLGVAGGIAALGAAAAAIARFARRRING